MNSSVGSSLRLDDLYKMTAHIYADRNSVRSKEATFAHFVEVCGMLTLADRKKKREKVDFADALCKALGWYFPLLAKLRIESVEALVFRKFPSVCPYCRLAPHEEAVCKLVKGTAQTLNHADVITKFKAEWTNRPSGLDDWQRMFNRIYPRSVNDAGRSSIGLMEELGEMAEAVRVFDAHPQYFLGEAADTFSYIMGLANEHTIREAQEERTFSFEREFLSRYPGLCMQCGSRTCVCPAIPQATIGRMAKELEIRSEETPFITDLGRFAEQGSEASHRALENVGGYAGLVEKLPFDRGDANHALVRLCLRMASILDQANPHLADSLRAEAIKIGDAERDAGTAGNSLQTDSLLQHLRNAWRELETPDRNEIKSSGGMVSDLGKLLDKVHVLFVSCNPEESESLRLQAEQRKIRESLRRSLNGTSIVIDDLPAATTDDLRRALLERQCDILHFSGHANEGFLIFEDENGKPSPAPIQAIASLVQRYPSIQCVILNACDSIRSLVTPISPYTIGMEQSVLDETAIKFSQGFYDALGAGKEIPIAYKEGISAVELSGLDHSFIKLLPSNI